MGEPAVAALLLMVKGGLYAITSRDRDQLRRFSVPGEYQAPFHRSIAAAPTEGNGTRYGDCDFGSIRLDTF